MAASPYCSILIIRTVHLRRLVVLSHQLSLREVEDSDCLVSEYVQTHITYIQYIQMKIYSVQERMVSVVVDLDKTANKFPLGDIAREPAR